MKNKDFKMSKAHKLHESKESLVYEAIEHIPKLDKKGEHVRNLGK